MDATQILTHAFGPLISTYWWLVLLLVLIAFLKTPFMKGVLGEFLVNLAARLFLDKKTYTLFKNVTLPTKDGTTQIDHVIVSRYGVFVIETKNIKGWIFGDPKQKTWTSKIYWHTSKFQNPLHQNYKHIQTLQSALALDPDKVFSLVVFVGDSTFKTPMPDNVVYLGGYIQFIKSKTQQILSDSEVLAICDKIASGRLKPSIRTHRDHVKHVKTIVEEKQRQIDENACPKCGRPMTLRTAKSGDNQGKQFWGCTGYPKCRTVRQII
ncbi:nuclease-related domain-containing protein [Methylobacter sp. YRD-M1]|uniref:nuclease-related domain-containing protein n=1 Tax=Methylobacter sp. YRD-M1 TaxID=2911520 RepID=UPI00227A5307|nr:NERD domain-containing protein [Methylobacter sp. YRD-M1]WAK04590.1 NERD domain-containing protein [Methylobacter sp. YRD-M1]